MDLNHLHDWVGRSEERKDLVTTSPIAAGELFQREIVPDPVLLFRN